MKIIFFILLLCLGVCAKGQHSARSQTDSTGRIQFTCDIASSDSTQQALYNKVVSWFSSGFASSIGNIFISQDTIIHFFSQAQHNVIDLKRNQPNIVRYNLYISLAEKHIRLMLKDFVLFSLRNERSAKKNNGLPLQIKVQRKRKYMPEKNQFFYNLADSITNSYAATLSNAFR